MQVHLYTSFFNSCYPYNAVGLPSWHNTPASAGDIRDTGLSLGWEDTLEEGMATHPSILVWRIPWTEEPGRL